MIQKIKKTIRENYVTLDDIKRLIRDNEAEIRVYNSNFLPKIPMMGASAILVAILVSFFHTAMAAARGIYIVAYLLCCLFFALTKGGRVKKFALPCLYGASIILYLLVLYLSVVKGAEYPAAAMLIVLAIYPMLFIDKPQRFLTVEAVFYVLHSVLAVWIKGAELGQIDIVNGFIASLIGCFMGWFTMISRLRALDLERLLVIEKETDVLTGLHNRRKLFEVIAMIENKQIKRPTGVMMLDIDYFKKYNDTYGHAAGDACLKAFGAGLRSKNSDGRVEFFRYGGEEFVGFIWNFTKEEIAATAEDIRATVANLDLGHGNITSSIGYVYCDDENILNYETWIEKADAAAYMAKDMGRNRVAEAK